MADATNLRPVYKKRNPFSGLTRWIGECCVTTPTVGQLGRDSTFVEPQRPRHDAADLADLDAVGQPRAVVVSLVVDEDLGLVLQPAKGAAVHDAVPIALVDGAVVVLGLGMPTVGVYILLATLAAPALIELGITPLAAHFYVLYFGMLSMITPPIAIASFAAATVARQELGAKTALSPK